MGESKLRRTNRLFDLRKGLRIDQPVLITNMDRLGGSIAQIEGFLTPEECEGDAFVSLYIPMPGCSTRDDYARHEFETMPLSEEFLHIQFQNVLNELGINATFEALLKEMVSRYIPQTKAATWLLEKKIRPSETPAAEWRLKGEKDPHEGRYDGPRQSAGGDFTDDELAYRCGMANGRDIESIGVLYSAKDRIRWLSRRLAKAEELLKQNGLSL